MSNAQSMYNNLYYNINTNTFLKLVENRSISAQIENLEDTDLEMLLKDIQKEQELRETARKSKYSTIKELIEAAHLFFQNYPSCSCTSFYFRHHVFPKKIKNIKSDISDLAVRDMINQIDNYSTYQYNKTYYHVSYKTDTFTGTKDGRSFTNVTFTVTKDKKIVQL